MAKFVEEITDFTQNKSDIVDQASLLWRFIYSVVLKYRKDHKDWIIIRHEDLSRDPHSGFAEICQRLDLPFSSGVKNFISDYSQSSEPVTVNDDKNKRITRNSFDNIYAWKFHLDKEEIERICD